MRNALILAAVAGLAPIAAGIALAAPVTYQLPAETAQLRPGPGLETARNNCSACHSADYMAMQPPGKGKAFWEAEVAKMIKTYKAPISDTDAKVISEYLAENY
ncbi:hypothetical protein WDZ92_42355 [Nostoc sp. NIES-2111]